jgi:hypothetical protein
MAEDTTGKPYFLVLAVPFTSAAGEQKTVSTPAAPRDLTVIGAATSFTNASVRVSDSDGQLQISSGRVPIYALASPANALQGYQIWATPVRIPRGSVWTFEFTNGAPAEAAGTLVLICRQH